MDLTSDSLPWDSTDIVLWRQFLDTRTGARLIPKLLESVPALLHGGDVNAILIRSGDVRGFSAAARILLSMAQEPPATPAVAPTNYAALEDDAAWSDGQTLTPTPK